MQIATAVYINLQRGMQLDILQEWGNLLLL